MARTPRIVAPGLPHHVTQRGNRRQEVFSSDDDYALYRDLMAASCQRYDVEVWSYCLMPNHVHLALVPATENGSARAVGEAHRRYSAVINARLRVTGHLFQGRFGSVAMDEAHWMAAARYIAMNPVKAGLARTPWEWRWSSSPAHVQRTDDGLVKVRPLLERTDDIRVFLASEIDPAMSSTLKNSYGVERPLMSEEELIALEARLGRRIRPAKRGRKPRAADGESQIGLDMGN